MARVNAVLAFGAAFAVITFVLFEAGRRAPLLLLPVVGPIGGLAITAIGSFISGALFFSSPVLWLRDAASSMTDPAWLVTGYVVGPFFVYGSIHGLFIATGLKWAQMARAVARRYIATFVAVGAVGLALGMVTMALDS